MVWEGLDLLKVPQDVSILCHHVMYRILAFFFTQISRSEELDMLVQTPGTINLVVAIYIGISCKILCRSSRDSTYASNPFRFRFTMNPKIGRPNVELTRIIANWLAVNR